jgi:hypothetical protein
LLFDSEKNEPRGTAELEARLTLVPADNQEDHLPH